MALSQAYSRPAFTKIGTKAADDQTDLVATRRAIDEATKALNDRRKDLNGLKQIPLAFGSTYRHATETQRDEKEFLNKADSLLKDSRADLDYFDKGAALKAKYESVGTTLEQVGNNDSPETVAAKLDDTAKQLETATAEETALIAPPYLKASQDQEIQDAKQVTNLLHQTAQATRDLDVATLNSLDGQFAQLSTDSDNHANNAILAYQKDSPVAKESMELNLLGRQLDKDYR